MGKLTDAVFGGFSGRVGKVVGRVPQQFVFSHSSVRTSARKASHKQKH